MKLVVIRCTGSGSADRWVDAIQTSAMLPDRGRPCATPTMEGGAVIRVGVGVNGTMFIHAFD